MKDKLRELAERMRGINGHCADALTEILDAEGDGGAVGEVQRDVCPITKRPFFMSIEHPSLGIVYTYGGPFDSYTIPEPDEDGCFRSERYDHDAGEWIEGGNPEPLMLVHDDEYNDLYDRANNSNPARSGVVRDEDVIEACEHYDVNYEEGSRAEFIGMRAALEHFAKGERHV